MVFLLSPGLLRTLAWSIEYGYLFRMTPFRWDTKVSQAYFPPASNWFYHWDRVRWVFLLYQGFLLVRTLQSVLDRDTGSQDKLMFMILEGALTTALLVSSILQILIIHRGREIVDFTNRYVRFCLDVQGAFARKGTDVLIPSWHLEVQLVLGSVFLASLFTPFLVLFFFVKFPNIKVNLGSTVLRDSGDDLLVRILWALPSLWLITLAWAAISALMSIFLIFTYVTIFLQKELRPKVSEHTRDGIRAPPNVLRLYRCLQLLQIEANSLTRDYVLMFVNNLQTVLGVICNVVLIKLHSTVSVEATLSVISCSFTATVYLVLTYIKFGTVHGASKALVLAWTRAGRASKLMSRHVRSFQVLRVELGSFGYYRKPTSIRVVGKLIFYTAKTIMLTKGYL